MFGRKKLIKLIAKEVVSYDAGQLRKVVNLIPEYVEAIVEELRLRGDAAVGLDGREFHGPAERKLKKIENRLAMILGNDSPEPGGRK